MSAELDHSGKHGGNAMLAALATAHRTGKPANLGNYAHPAVIDYYQAMTDQAVAEASVTESTNRRAAAVAAMHADGWSYQTIANVIGLTRSRVQQLAERGKAAR